MIEIRESFKINVLKYVTQNIHQIVSSSEFSKNLTILSYDKELVNVIIDKFSFHEYLIHRYKFNNVTMTL
jgi:hypothetical protein